MGWSKTNWASAGEGGASWEGFLLTRIASLYHEHGLTQQEIADRLGLSRVQVVRKLKKASELGYVRVIIDSPFLGDVQLSARVQEAFGLRDALVVPGAEDEGVLRSALGRAGASYLVSRLKPNMVLGVAWGRTLQQVAIHLPRTSIKNLVVGNFVGGLSSVGDRGAQELAAQIGMSLGGRVSLLNVPFRVDSRDIRDALMRDSHIRQRIELMSRADLLLVGIGDVEDPGLVELYASEGLYDPQFIRAMKERGAVGEIIGHYFDLEGRFIPSPMYETIVGLSPESFPDKGNVICVAGGRGKVRAILGAVRGRLVHVLITDTATAEALLRLQEGREGNGGEGH